MADSEDRTQREGVSADGRPRRQPPIIDVEAVEVSLEGSPATTAGSDPTPHPSAARRWPKRLSTFLSAMRLTIIGSACFIAAIIGGALWIYFGADASDGLQRHAGSPTAAVPDDVVTRIAKLEAALRVPPSQPPSQPSSPPPRLAAEVGDLGSRVAGHDAKLAALTDRIASLEGAVRDAAAAARVAGERAAEVAGRSDADRGNSDEQNRTQQDDRSALDDLANRVAMLESQQTALQREQEGLDRVTDAIAAVDKAVRLATVAVALRSTLERNSPFAAELAAARSLGADEKALASLAPFAATGLPTPSELFHELSTLLPELRRLSAPPGKDLGYLDRLQASAVKMLNIRPVQNQPGDDPATVMSRIEFQMAQQDVGAMVVELDKLPAPARELARPWRSKVLARQDALEAAQRIATASLAQLGEPRGPSPR
jgi:hypothetical protein